MSGKFNDDTPNRPHGARVLDAPMVRINLTEYSAQIRTEAAWLNGDRNAITVLHNPHMRIVLVALKEGAEMTRHSVDAALSIHILSGRLWIEGESHSFSADEGEIVAMHPALSHYVFAEKESLFLLTLAGNADGEF